MRKATLIPLLALLAPAALRAADPPLRIGVCGPMTGDQGKMGEDILHGAELAVAEWNARGGVLGRKIEIVAGDDQHDPKQARAVAQRMKNERVAGVVGHFNTGCTVPASDVYYEAGIPMITPSATNPQVTERGYENVFRVCGRDDQQAPAAARYTVETAKARRVAILHDNSAYGKGLADLYKADLAGKAEVVYYGGIVQGDMDYKAVLANVKDKAPDLWFFGGMYPEAAKLVKQGRELGLTATFVSGDGTYDPQFLKVAGPAAEGAVLTFGPDFSKLPSAQPFLEGYKKKFGDPGPYSIYSYDAAHILLHAIAQAKCVDGAKVAEAIRSREHDGAFGKIAFDAKGDMKQAPYICWRVEKGAFVPMESGEPSDLPTATTPTPPPATTPTPPRKRPTLVEVLILDQVQPREYEDNAAMLKDVMNSVWVVVADKSMGSGVAISKSHLLTNAHVVGSKEAVSIKNRNGDEFPAKVIHVDEKWDVALLQVDGGRLYPCPTTNSDLIKIGEDVFAVGAPLGEALSYSVTKGIVSGIREDLNKARLIQTDVAMNHGSSGGPLVNQRGCLTSIVTWKVEGGGTEGLGFCIAINDALRAARVTFK
jgi:branched-chain amino acid transport system substrate-binding protein